MPADVAPPCIPAPSAVGCGAPFDQIPCSPSPLFATPSLRYATRPTSPSMESPISRRTALKTTALAAAALTMPAFAARGSSRLKVGVIGCGGRGRGAAHDCLTASPDTEIVALADMFPERIKEALDQ